MILDLKEQDATKLNSLTENQWGKRLLIVCRNKVIAAPVLSTTLAAKQISFAVKYSGTLDVFRDR